MTPKYKVGDFVIFTNSYGVCFGEREIVSVEERTGKPCYIIKPTDTPWFAVPEDELSEVVRNA